MILELPKSCERTVGIQFFMSLFKGSCGFSLAVLGTMHPYHGFPEQLSAT